MRQFGDSAVIILDFCEFLRRMLTVLIDRWGDMVFMADKVSFFNFNKSQNVTPLFSKSIQYAYQNEFRIAVCELQKNVFVRGPGADEALTLVPDLTPIRINIGNIKDIAFKIPIDDFLNLRLPSGFRYRWPMSDDPKKQTIFDMIVKDTRKRMKNYKSHTVKPTFTIY